MQLASSIFSNACFAIVNRDDEAARQVAETLKENQLEDYLNGLPTVAKNQGADYLFLVDITIYSEEDKAVQYETDIRLINVENNQGYHTFYRSDVITQKNMATKASENVEKLRTLISSFISEIFPEQYGVVKGNGKTWLLVPYQPNGRILNDDNFYAFKLKKELFKAGEMKDSILVLQKFAVCKKPTPNGGYVQVKSDVSESDFSDVVLIKDNPYMILRRGLFRATFFGLPYDTDTYDGLAKKRINNAVFSAITRHKGMQLIEHDQLMKLKQERELQKGEDFLDGHVVEQMKAVGAKYLIKLESYKRVDTQVEFKLVLISIADNSILRIVDVNTSIDNIENEMYKQICDRVVYPCVVKKLNKNSYEMATTISLVEGDNCILMSRNEIKNPMTGEVSYSTSDVCSIVVDEYRGNKCILSVDKIIDKELFSSLEKNSLNGLVTFRIDGSKIKSNTSSQSDVAKAVEKQEKAEKRKKLWNALKAAGKGMFKVTATPQ